MSHHFVGVRSLVALGALGLVGFVVGCGSTGEPVGQSSEAVSGSSGSGATGPTTNPVCPPDEKICLFGDPDPSHVGDCISKCVPDTYLCVAPPSCGHIVCDPNGPQPRPGCSWDETTCTWECPVCDPTPEPRPGCSWNETTCVWDCPVCDPNGPPPEPGCQWDGTKCVWLCL
jgi:hypothetical protein